MRLKLNFDGGFFDFLKKRGGLIKAILVIALGVLLIALASGGNEESTGSNDELAESVREFCESVEGVGECRVIITYTTVGDSYYSSSSKKVYAVAISCKGARSTSVRAELTELVSSMFGIGANRVSVLPLD